MPFSGLKNYDEHDPASFYLERETLRESADAVLLVEGMELPVHKGLLTVMSAVFEDAFILGAQAATVDTEQDRPPKRPRHSNFFEGFTVKDVAVFLRLLYDPAVGMGQLRTAAPQQFASVARLAHKFDIQHLLSAVESVLAKDVLRGKDINSNVRLAEQLNLKKVLAVGATMTARRLCAPLTKGKPQQLVHDSLMDASRLAEELSPAMLQLVLGALTSAVKAAAEDGGNVGETLLQLAEDSSADVSVAPALTKWVELRGVRGEYKWEVPNYRSAVTADSWLQSPQFVVGGQAFQVALRLRDTLEEQQISVSLEAVGADQWPAGKANAKRTLPDAVTIFPGTVKSSHEQSTLPDRATGE
ncbi:hypothetical protein N2152v2_006856 [Parachlorella kessleri]